MQLLFALAACGVSLESESTPDAALPPDVVVSGALPEGVDVAALVADLPVGSFQIVGDPNGEVAVLQRLGTERVGTFVATGPASCLECGLLPCTGSVTRTVQIELEHTGGDTGEHVTTTVRRENFSSVTPATFDVTEGSRHTLSIGGTVGVCAPFSYRFDIEAVIPPVQTSLPSANALCASGGPAFDGTVSGVTCLSPLAPAGSTATDGTHTWTPGPLGRITR